VRRSSPGSPGQAATRAFGAWTDVGRVRATNEDRFVARPPLFLVADGMGGQNAGEVAAAIAADLLEAAAADRTIHTVGDLAAALERANAAVWQRAGMDRALEGMGTTCTAAIVDGSRLLVAHVGDSRAYLLRRHELRQLTIDHTLMQRLVDDGRIQPADVATHPQRSVVIRAIGAAAEVAADRLVIELEPGDRLLLCSDGLSGQVPADEIETALAADADAQAAAERLVDLANAAGGADNVTAVVVDPDRVAAAAAAGQAQPTNGARSVPQTMVTGASGRLPSSGRRTAVGALLLVLTIAIAILAAAVVLAPSAAPAATPATPAASPATPAATPATPGATSPASPTPSPGLGSPSGVASPFPTVQSSPSLAPPSLPPS
jgi:serine/threonine protein phosphatase PrpC